MYQRCTKDLSDGMTEPIIRLRSIEAFDRLSKSPYSKIIVTKGKNAFLIGQALSAPIRINSNGVFVYMSLHDKLCRKGSFVRIHIYQVEAAG